MLTLLICLLARPPLFLARQSCKAVVAQADAKKAFANSNPGRFVARHGMDYDYFTIRAYPVVQAICNEGIQVKRTPKQEILCSTWKGIVCSRPIIVMRGIVLAGRADSPDGNALEFGFSSPSETRGVYLKDMVIAMIDATKHSSVYLRYAKR